MKKIILTIGTALLTSLSFAQCKYQKNLTDEFTGDIIKVLELETIITHTDSLLKKYYKNRDYLTVNTKVASINGDDLIYFTGKILTKDAYDYYGALRKDSQIILKLKNGKIVKLNIGTGDYGDVNYEYDYTFYSIYCDIDDIQKNILLQSEVDKIRIYWSEGYEDYDCDNGKVYLNQLPCLR